MYTIEPNERFMDAVDDWAEARMTDRDDAIETKAEQALLEIEHLVSEAHEVEFEVEDGTIRFDPNEETDAFLQAQADRAGVDPETVIDLHVNLFANAFLDQTQEGEGRPPDTPPVE